MISKSNLVESFFGYWPEFADAKVIGFYFEKTGAITFELFYIDAQAGKTASVTLRFSDVSNVALTNLMSENVLDGLSISPGNPMTVDVESCYGLEGKFECTVAEVISVVPNSMFKPDASRRST